MTERRAGSMGVAAFTIFWIALFTFAAARPDYSHFTKAVSELGVIGAPHAVAWNLIGFIVPGALLAVCGAGLATAIDGRRGALWWLLVLSGLCLAGAGAIPAEMRNGSPAMESSLTQAHLLMASLAPVLWAIAALLAVRRFSRSTSWRSLTPRAVVFAVVCVGGFLLSIIAPAALPFLADKPGLSQRFCFAAYFSWYLLVSFQLLSTGSRVAANLQRPSGGEKQ